MFTWLHFRNTWSTWNCRESAAHRGARPGGLRQLLEPTASCSAGALTFGLHQVFSLALQGCLGNFDVFERVGLGCILCLHTFLPSSYLTGLPGNWTSACTMLPLGSGVFMGWVNWSVIFLEMFSLSSTIFSYRQRFLGCSHGDSQLCSRSNDKSWNPDYLLVLGVQRITSAKVESI